MGLFGKKNKDREALGTDSAFTPPQDAVNDNARMFNSQKEHFDKDGRVIKDKIGVKEIREASQTLKKYKDGKANLEKRIIDNEQWWKLRHWEQMRKQGKAGNKLDIQPRSAWLFNSIMSKYADYMDAYPEPNILPREEGDEQEAKMLSSIVPVVFQQNGFEQVYSDEAWYKLKAGTGVYGCFWDSSKMNGLGDIAIKKIDILNLFWEPGITDIQESSNVFHVNLVNNKTLEQRYPQLKGKLGGKPVVTSEYLYDDTVDTSDKSVVIDWYYHTEYNGKRVLHYCKYVNDVVLYASENDTERPTELRPATVLGPTGENRPVMVEIEGNPEQLMEEVEVGESIAERGWYDHGEYPFITDVLFPVEGSLCGFSYIDVCKDPQLYIDRLKQAILKNALMGASPRYFYREDGQVNEEDFMDFTKPLVKVSGTISDDNLREIPTKPLNGIYVNVLNNEIQEMKETTGNTDVANGNVGGGVTSGSAIAALQESAGKTSRSQNKGSYRAYAKLVTMVIELIRQFYDVPRQFRITGEYGQEEYVSYSNQNIKAQAQGYDFGVDMGYRLPVFDVEVSAQKQNPYAKNSQNEMAIQFYNMGFFNPQFADQALACLDAMDFNQKYQIQQKIQQNGTLLQENEQLKQQMLQMASILDTEKGTTMAQDLAMAFGLQPGQPMPEGSGDISLDPDGEHPFNERAREQSQEATQVR